MSKIYMFWYKVPFGKKNFGDELGPYIVEKLSGKKVAYIPLLHKGLNKKTLLAYPKAIYTRKIKFIDIIDNIKFLFFGGNVLITIGSIFGWYSTPKCNVWGTGIMLRDENIKNANFYAVRGKFTQKRLFELGFKVPEAIGDPALLMPLLYKPKKIKKFTLGIIPHHFHYEEIKRKVGSSKIRVINLLDGIEQIIEEVCSCDLLVSSSLHGIIISHAYKKPCAWFNLSKRTIGGDNIKFKDYFSSVEIEPYEPIDLDFFDENSIDVLNKLFESKKHLFSVKSYDIIKKLQIGLINSAPFKVLDIYKN